MSKTLAVEAQSIHAPLLERYQRAWAEADLEAIVDNMTEDGLYEASFGPEPYGQRFFGRAAIRAGIEAMWAGTDERGTHDYHDTYILGDHAFATWSSTKRGPDGQEQTTHGADFYEFRDGLVAKKIAYRKARG
jgi:uncharacterized protein (TIGR02246 family)